MNGIEFVPFPKLPRLSREIVITEKIDGTNACIRIDRYDPLLPGDRWVADESNVIAVCKNPDGSILQMRAGSRTRWTTPEDDNHGFARWAQDQPNLFLLGAGTHFGEWWGGGIQRGYGMPKGEKHFSLFNTGRWTAKFQPEFAGQTTVPPCCGVVPELYRGVFEEEMILDALGFLERVGSRLVKEYHPAEGIVIYHTAANQYFKKTLKKDESPKGIA